MKAQYYILVFLLAFASNIANAQSTGYMGKRVLFGYGFNTSPITFGSSAGNESLIGNGGSAETGSIVFNAIHEGFLEVAPSSRLMIGFSARYYNTTYDNAREWGYDYSYSGVSQNWIDQKPRGYYNIMGLSYTLYIRYFGVRYVAPWGRYVMFGPVINTTKTTYDPSTMYALQRRQNIIGNYEDYKVTDFGQQGQTYSGFNVMFGMGRSRMIQNRVTLDYGFNTHVGSLLMLLFDISGINFNRSYALSNPNYIENTVKTRVRGVNRFNVFLKVGILLF